MDMISQPRPVLSVVIPLYNEAEIIGEMHRRLAAVMAMIGAPWEAIYVNDGSHDASLRMIDVLRQADRHIAVRQPVAQLRQGDRHHRRARPCTAATR